jgi:RNA polymerase sigma factor (sigma-70 family)
MTKGSLVSARSSGVPPGLVQFEGVSDGQLLEQFVRHSNGVAFAALVARHGQMVLGVCRRVLRNHQDAQDAFQATFLVLVRKADSLRNPDLLANWLYGVAYRTAQQARARAARRRHHEREAAFMFAPATSSEMERQELRELLDKELYELPEKYRAPLVLCYLEGKTNQEAAELLGWPPGSMSARLARGREMLRDRLAGRRPDRKETLAGLLPLFMVLDLECTSVPPALADATVQAAVGLVGAKAIPAGVLTAGVQGLLEATLHDLGGARRWLIGLLLALLAALAVGGLALAAGRGEGTTPKGSISSGGTVNTSCH